MILQSGRLLVLQRIPLQIRQVLCWWRWKNSTGRVSGGPCGFVVDEGLKLGLTGVYPLVLLGCLLLSRLVVLLHEVEQSVDFHVLLSLRASGGCVGRDFRFDGSKERYRLVTRLYR